MIKERVIQIVEYLNIPKEEFYRKIGMTSANFRGSAKKTPLNSNAIENIISEIPGVNIEWLLTGKGEMLVSKEPIPDPNRPTITAGIASDVTEVNDADVQVSTSDKRSEDFIQIIKEQQNTITDMQRTISEMSSTINILAKRGDAGTVTGVVSRAASE